MQKIKIILADDHSLVRAGIKSLIKEFENIEVVAEANNGREAITKVEDLIPDVLLLDISMPELNGLEVASRLKKSLPELKIIMLSMHSNEEYVYQVLKEGVDGYLLKDSIPSELELAINSVINGKTYLSPEISKTIVEDYLSGNKRGKEKIIELEAFKSLTSRQREILQLIAEGNSTKEIANKLHISVKTVDTHRTQLMKKLDIHDVTGLVRYAIRTGIIRPEN